MRGTLDSLKLLFTFIYPITFLVNLAFYAIIFYFYGVFSLVLVVIYTFLVPHEFVLALLIKSINLKNIRNKYIYRFEGFLEVLLFFSIILFFKLNIYLFYIYILIEITNQIARIARAKYLDLEENNKIIGELYAAVLFILIEIFRNNYI